MRLFAAIPVLDPAHAVLVDWLAALRGAAWPVRWTGDDGLHLTLKFFGEVAPERLPAVVEALRSAATGTGALALELTELGAFPGGGRARIFWAGIAGPPALELLQHRVERAAEAIGFPTEGRPFRPHITLGRVRDGKRLALASLVAKAPRLEPAAFLAEQVVLYESDLGAGREGMGQGPRYTPRAVVPLEAAWAV